MAKKGEQTKQAIREISYGLFAKYGFKDVTMSMICEATGLSRGGLYRHYSSTAAIFSEILSEEYSFDERMNNNDSAKKILLDTLAIIEEEIMDKEKSLSLAIYEYASISEDDIFETINENAKNRWKKLIEYGIKNKEFKNVDANQVAEMILYYYQGLRMWSRVVPFTKNVAENYSKNICDLVLR